MTTVLEVARPHCATEVLEDEVVALNVETGVYFSLRGLAATLWLDLDAGHPVETLATGSDAERITAFIDQLVGHGLMRPAGAREPTTPPASAARPDAGPDAEIVFEVYEDMQDLILSDPVHDVDETVGWPAVRPERA